VPHALLLFVLGVAGLILAARLFTRSSEAIGLALGMSQFAVGVLIVSVGTSLPELVASLVAVGRGTSQIVAGNVLGANVSNLLLVLGAVAIAAPRALRLGEHYLFIDLHFLVASAFLIALSMWDGRVGRGEAVFLVLAYSLYVVYLLRAGRPASSTAGGTRSTRPGLRPLDLVLAAAAAAAIYLAARLTITSLEAIATGLDVPPAVIAVTLLSLGTTLPELVVSAVAARHGKSDVAVGNILGSCIFNSLAVTGLAALVGPLEVPLEIVTLPLPVFVGGALLFYLLTQDKRVSGWEGALLVLLYGFFAVKVVRLF
jgi:cation:H+ antiporter